MKNILEYVLLSIFTTLIAGQDLSAAVKMPELFQIIPQPLKVELLRSERIDFGGLHSLILEGQNNRLVIGVILSQLTEPDKTKEMPYK